MIAAIGQQLVSTGTAIRRYGAVMGALLRREQESRLQSPLGSILALLEPVMLVGTLSVIVWLMERRGSPLGGGIVLFLATGFFPIYFFMYISQRMRGSMGSHRRRFPVEHRLDYIFAHIILRVIDYAILAVVGFGILYIFVSTAASPRDYWPIFLSCLACVMFGFGWGIFNIVVTDKIPIWKHFVPAINRLFVFVSGVLFVPDYLSPGIRHVLSFNPLMHVVTLFRQGFYANYPSLTLDFDYLAFSVIVALVIGLMLERISRRRSEQ